MAAAADSPTAAATDLAEFLVDRRHAVPRRPRRRRRAGAASLDGERPLADLVAAHPALGPDAVALLEPGASVRRRTTRGGAGPAPVADQLERFRPRLAGRPRPASTRRPERHGPSPRDPGPLRRGRPAAGGLQRPLPRLRRRRHGPLDARASTPTSSSSAGTSCSSGPSSTGTARPGWATCWRSTRASPAGARPRSTSRHRRPRRGAARASDVLVTYVGVEPGTEPPDRRRPSRVRRHLGEPPTIR